MSPSPISAVTPPTPKLATQIAGLKDLSRTERERITSAVDTENRLVGEAVTKLGGTPTPVTSLQQLAPSHNDPFSTGTKPDRALNIPLGTVVSDAPQSKWSVTGVRDGMLQLARRNPTTNAVETAAKSVADLASHSSSLVEDQWTDAVGKQWTIIADPDSVQASGRDAAAKLVRSNALKLAALGVRKSIPKDDVVPTTWGSVLDSMQTGKRIPKAAPASEDGAVDLRHLVGDKTLVTSAVGTDEKLRRMLVATSAAPEGARDAIKGAGQVQKWFKDKAGITFWPGDEPLVIATDEPEYVANAAAGIGYDGTDRHFVLLEGPRSESIRQAVLHREPGGKTGDRDRLIRHFSDAIKGDDQFVRYHEAGHIADGMTWSHISRESADAMKSTQKGLETSMVDEAFADLFGLARSGNAHPVVRNLTSLRPEWSSLSAFRSMQAKQGKGVDVHAGTQLITKPMAEFSKAMGADALAEVTGGANQLLAARLSRGDFEVVDVPKAARALIDAASSRYGADVPAVQALRQSWSKLGVGTTTDADQ